MAENISSQGELDEAKEALLTDCVVKAATCPLVQAIIEDIPALSPGMIESSWFKLDEERPIAINKLLHTLDNVPHKFEDAVFGGFGDAVSESERLLNILRKLERTFSSRIIGQAELVRMVLVAMVLNEHTLLEGLPGVSKTEIVKWIAQVSGLPFSRVQFIPDMLPSDLIDKDHVDIAKLGSKDPDAVHWVNGPIFSCIVLADEINRAPSKVQAALLEAMGERQVTPFGKLSRPVLSPLHEGALRVWATTDRYRERGLLGFQTPIPENPRELQDYAQFTVFATMNPIEQEGTYPLSEAQMDRFCFKVLVPYPAREHYEGISRAVHHNQSIKAIECNLPVEDCEAYFRKYPRRMLPILLPAYFFLRCRTAILPLKLHAADGRKPIIARPLREAAAMYAVTSDVDGGRPKLLADYLSRRCGTLVRNCPRSPARQQAILGPLLGAPAGAEQLDEKERTWLKDARRWLQLSTLLTTASLACAPGEFFERLCDGLQADEELWRPGRGDQDSSIAPWNSLSVAARPAPASFLLDLRRANAAAEATAAASRFGQVHLGPYLEMALEGHWSRLLRQTSLIEELFGNADQGGVRLTARIVPQANDPSAPAVPAAWRTCRARTEDGMEISLMFLARTCWLAENPQRYRIRLTMQRHRDRSRLPLGIRPSLGAPLGDVQWALDEFFEDHAMTVTAEGGLAFANLEELDRWLPGATDNQRESKTRAMARVWREAGPPSLRQGSGDEVGPKIQQWLVRMAQSAR